MKKSCLGCILEIGIGRSYLVEKLVRGYRCAMSWYDLGLTFDLVVVALTFKILFGLYLGNQKVTKWILGRNIG